jgi:hypothetical protein
LLAFRLSVIASSVYRYMSFAYRWRLTGPQIRAPDSHASLSPTEWSMSTSDALVQVA